MERALEEFETSMVPWLQPDVHQSSSEASEAIVVLK